MTEQNTQLPKNNEGLETINEIKRIMERSSRFDSLSGWSALSAGFIAIVGALLAFKVLKNMSYEPLHIKLWDELSNQNNLLDFNFIFNSSLFLIGITVFLTALSSTLLFTYLRGKKLQVSVWNNTSKRVLINVLIPMIVAFIILIRVIQFGLFGFITPICLIFYGLGLVNAGKYTIAEVRYLGIGMILLGLINCWFISYGLYFWAAGFGLLHIIYGVVIWLTYENNQVKNEN